MQTIGSSRATFLIGMTAVLNNLSKLLNIVDQHKIIVWNNQQQKKLCGFVTSNEITIDQLQTCMEKLVDVYQNCGLKLKCMTELLKKVPFLADEDTVTGMTWIETKIKADFEKLICKCFLVEVQPPQVCFSYAFTKHRLNKIEILNIYHMSFS